MAELCPIKIGAKVVSRPILCQKVAIKKNMDFKFVLPIIFIDNKGQTKLEVN